MVAKLGFLRNYIQPRTSDSNSITGVFYLLSSFLGNKTENVKYLSFFIFLTAEFQCTFWD